MEKKFFVSMLILCASAHLSAKTLGAQKFCYVDFNTAIAREAEAQNYLQGLETAENDINNDEQKARADIEKKMTDFRSSMASLSEKARQEREAKLSAEISQLQQQFTQRRMEQNQKREQISRQLEAKNKLLIDSLARNNNCDITFNAAAIVSVSDEMKQNDLTPKLVESYNKAYPVKKDSKTSPKTSVAPKAPVKK
ncbi:MAG: OmpH family outer membrane protein [Myxococcales bacterium]|nr:OmpH family outer membrane protein [Myxococcales bacterium]USN50521.1 MAG: OmpH family outer membrane protein [Myxococcales bacterium]